ncbi:MAG TPA: serine protease [Anaeromyxobacteraceae bacterium]|nr:serine protease [Anaeromyxobacteraceae bacterium]
MLTRSMLVILVAGLSSAWAAEGGRAIAPASASASAASLCAGDYADDLSALSARARDLEQRQKPFTFCIRASAVYECPSYAADGTLQTTRHSVVQHGTGFAYRRQGTDTLLLTNDHIAAWPGVTDDDHQVTNVPNGCKRVSDKLTIVDDENDGYERDDIPLARLVTDPRLDLAILRSRTPLPTLPWKVGRSSALHERNAIDVRGFPLGILRANNGGRIVSSHKHDEAFEWNHEDFVVDALLSPGNSGSPVLAVSCRTGEFELVGVYHARYLHGSALHEVIAIDQARDFMDTLEPPPSLHVAAPLTLDMPARRKLLASASATPDPYFEFGDGGVAVVRPRADGALVFEVMAPDFPTRTVPALAVEDLPPEGGAAFGSQGRVWAGNRQGLRLVDRAQLNAASQEQLARVLDALRRDALAAFAYRDVARAGDAARERFDTLNRLENTTHKAAASRADLVDGVLQLASQWCADHNDTTLTVAELLRPRSATTPISRHDGGAAVAASAPLALSPPR